MRRVKSGTGVPAIVVADGAATGVPVTAGVGAWLAAVGACAAGLAVGRVVAGAPPEQPTKSAVTNEIAATARYVGCDTAVPPYELEP